MLIFFNKSKGSAESLFEHKQFYRSSVLGLIIIGNFSLEFGAKELSSASVLPTSWKMCFRAALVTWIMPPGASFILKLL